MEMTSFLRILKPFVPKWIRRVYWAIRSAYSYSFSDVAFRKFSELDYEKYWEARDTSSGELTHERKSGTEVVCELLRSPSSVLDVGCGDGLTMFYIKKRHPLLKELCIDISSTAVEIACSRGINAKAGDMFDMSLDTYDCVLLMEVLQHVPNCEEFLNKIKSYTKGKIIVSLPNIAYWRYRCRLFFGGRAPKTWLYHPGEHLRFWSIIDFKYWAQQLGLKVTQIIPIFGYESSWLINHFPNVFASNVIFVLEPSQSATNH
jgi:methionine biosynthesis protein MetW